jgi:hypothetical protein
VYLSTYRTTLKSLRHGETVEEIREWHRAELARIDWRPVEGDEWGKENWWSCHARAIEDAAAGRKRNLIWTDNREERLKC